MSKYSRDKGQRGEREIAALIADYLGYDVRRRVRNHAGDSDLVGVPGWSIEVKNCASITVPAWWRQTVDQWANSPADDNSLPVLFYKIPRRGWRAVWPIAAAIGVSDFDAVQPYEYTCDSSVAAWAALARECPR